MAAGATAALDLLINLKDEASKGLDGLGGNIGALAGPFGMAAGLAVDLGGKLLEAGRAAGAEKQEQDLLAASLARNTTDFNGNTTAVDDQISHMQALAFADSDARTSLDELAQATGSLQQATQLQGVAADFARQHNLDLGTATDIVKKVQMGHLNVLERYGINVDKNTTSTEALALMQSQSAGAADQWASSAEGAAIRSSASMDDAMETIGGAVLPLVQSVQGAIADFLNSPTFQAGIAFLTDLLTNGLGNAFAFIQSLLGPLQGALQPLIDAFLGLGTNVSGTQGPLDGFKAVLDGAQAFILSTVIPVIGQVATFLADNLPAAVQFASDAWTNVLQPALALAWSFIQDNVLPIVGQIATFLADNLPGAIQFAADAWTNVLQPALALAWQFIQDNVLPIVGQVATFLRDNLPGAIQFASDAWTNVLQPALQRAWEFFNGSIIPVLTQVRDWLSTNLPPALQTLSDLWTNTLQPALHTVWDFITNSVIPILGQIVTEGFDKVKAGAQTLSDFWNGPLKDAFDAAGRFVSDTIGAFDRLKEAIGRAVSIGKDLIDGILKGLQQNASQVIEFIKGLAGQVIDQIKATLGIHSPSSIMEALFSHVGGGALAGLEASMPAVLAYLQQQVAAMGAIQPGALAVPVGVGGPGGAGGGAGGRPVIVNLTINAPGGDPQAVHQAARGGVLEGLRALGMA